MARMLECQSRQVPMKSKRTASICPVRFVGSVDIVVSQAGHLLISKYGKAV